MKHLKFKEDAISAPAYNLEQSHAPKILFLANVCTKVDIMELGTHLKRIATHALATTMAMYAVQNNPASVNMKERD